MAGLRVAQCWRGRGCEPAVQCCVCVVGVGGGVPNCHGILSEVQDAPLHKERARAPQPWAASLRHWAGPLCMPRAPLGREGEWGVGGCVLEEEKDGCLDGSLAGWAGGSWDGWRSVWRDGRSGGLGVDGQTHRTSAPSPVGRGQRHASPSPRLGQALRSVLRLLRGPGPCKRSALIRCPHRGHAGGLSRTRGPLCPSAPLWGPLCLCLQGAPRTWAESPSLLPAPLPSSVSCSFTGQTPHPARSQPGPVLQEAGQRGGKGPAAGARLPGLKAWLCRLPASRWGVRVSVPLLTRLHRGGGSARLEGCREDELECVLCVVRAHFVLGNVIIVVFRSWGGRGRGWGGEEEAAVAGRQASAGRPQGCLPPLPCPQTPGNCGPSGGLPRGRVLEGRVLACCRNLTCLPALFPPPPVAMDDEDGRCLLDVIW